MILALHDGARAAEQVGDAALAAALDAMSHTLVLANEPANTRGVRQWRMDDLQRIRQAALATGSSPSGGAS
jgi:type VI protein secretion system component VasF